MSLAPLYCRAAQLLKFVVSDHVCIECHLTEVSELALNLLNILFHLNTLHQFQLIELTEEDIGVVQQVGDCLTAAVLQYL